MDEEDVLKKLAAADWGTIGKTLRAHAIIRSTMYPRRTAGNGELGLGKTIEDIVNDAIVQTIKRERIWDPDKGELLPWLKRQVDSIMDHVFKGWHYRHETNLEVKDAKGHEIVETAQVQQHPFNFPLADQNTNPENALIEEENEKQYRQHIATQIQTIIDATEEEPELLKLVELCMTHGKDCEKIATAAGLPVSDIYRLLRKLRRRLESRTRKSSERMRNDQATGPRD